MREIIKSFGHALREARLKKNLSQERLAEKVGISRASIANYEIGAHSISLEHAALLAQELDFSLDIAIKSKAKGITETDLSALEPTLKEAILKAFQTKE